MPASLVRVCPACLVERETPSAFRDPGVTGPGRPPTVCRACRELDSELEEAYQRSIATRRSTAARKRRYAARTTEALLLDQRAALPDGLKVCPPVSGCGQRLPFSAFATSRIQHDGLETLCVDCKAQHAALRALKSA